MGLPTRAPPIPYRPLSESEQRGLFDYANTLRTVPAQDEFWQATRPAALERIARIREGGFVVSEPRGWGCSSEGYGEHIHIYPSGTNLLEFRGGHERSRVIGSLGIWEAGGFTHEPLWVWYSPDEGGVAQIKEALTLRAFLHMNAIPFAESGRDATEIAREIETLRSGIEARNYLLRNR